MGINYYVTKSGSYELHVEQWCDGGTWITKEGNSLDMNELFSELQKIEKLEKERGELKNYIDICLDNSKEQLIRRITKLEKMIDDLHSELYSKKQECYSRGEHIAELEKANNTLHKLMVSGEKRGDAKATEDYLTMTKRIAELEKEHDAIKREYKDDEAARQRFEYGLKNGE
jgi:uncharacterized protein Yka (UPF0111/DUF47 family)